MVHKQKFTNTLAAEAKEAALHGNMRAIYNTNIIFQKKFGKSLRPEQTSRHTDVHTER